MTGLAEGCAGLALVMGFGLLCTRQVRPGFACLAVQSASVAGAAAAGQELLLMIPPVAMAAAIWMARDRSGALEQDRERPLHPLSLRGAERRVDSPPSVPPSWGLLRRFAPRNDDFQFANDLPTAPYVAAGGVLVLLCQLQNNNALPLAIALLGVLLAAMRRRPVIRLLALGAMQNGIVLSGCLAGWNNPWFPLACLVLPLPLALNLVARPRGMAATAWQWSPRRAAPWLGRAGFAIRAAIFVLTLTVPLGPLASVFAPLFAFDSLVRSWIERNRAAVPLACRAAALVKLGFILLAVSTPDPILAWLAVLFATAASLLPAAPAHRDRVTLAYFAAALALFGLVTVSAEPTPIGFLGLFGGYAILAAAIPDLAIPLLVLILRFASQTAWPPEAGAIGTGIALTALLTCSVLLSRTESCHRTVLLQLAQASIAALAIATSQPDGRFAAIVLLILLILTRTASRAAGGPAGMLAIAGLAGLPPLGVFPGLVLVVLAVGNHAPWLLIPLGAGLIPLLLAGIPARRPVVSLRAAMLSVGWLPLALALAFGFFAPAGLVHWLSALAAAPS